MSDKIYSVLFLCTGNSARSIMAECILNRFGIGKFKGYSAGSRPAGTVNPMTITLLRRLNYGTDTLRSKNWDEFAQPDSPPLDFVFTVCDNAAGEVCPIWPGQPMTAHWGIQDPAAFVGSEDKTFQAFKRAYLELEGRIKIFTSLRMDGLDRLLLQKKLDAIGRQAVDPAEPAGA